MRVTHVITRLIVGGAQENTVGSVLGLLHKPGVSVDLVSGPTAGPEGSLEHRFDEHTGVLRIAPHLIRPVRPLADWLAFRELTRLYRTLRPDIVHTHSGKAGVLGRLAARRAGVPVIVHTIHGPSFGPFQGRIANGLFTAAERYAAGCTTHFVTVAHAMTRRYLEAGIGAPEQYTRVLSGFALDPFLTAKNDPKLRAQYGLAPEDFVVGKIARLFELKGHEDLFAIAPELVRHCPRMKFLLVGGGPWRERLGAEVRRRGLEKHFVFTGLVKPTEIPSLVGLMDTLVHLSAREGLARALPQALAAGKPVVAYDSDGTGEVCLDDQTGFLVRPGDRERLVSCLAKLANDPALRERLGRSGREMVRELFPIERMVDELHALYLRLVGQPPHANTAPTPVHRLKT